jgi:5-methyltetrahydropteroyltriglutamate--homocysteine methyltransferase
MKEQPLRTTVIGSYPFPSWLELATQQLDKFGTNEIAELQEDAVIVAIHDQVEAGLDVITDGEQSRLDFNLSFYGYLQGIQPNERPLRVFGPPAHDQRGKHDIVDEIAAPRGLGVVEEYERLKRLAPAGFTLKASVPGPYTLSGRLNPSARYPDRYAVTEALLPKRIRSASWISSTGPWKASPAGRIFPRICASAILKPARWGRGVTRRCSPISST